jgi:hypothetical protein
MDEAVAAPAQSSGGRPPRPVRVERYAPTNQDEWNAVVRASRNGTFLIERGYMDYHGDRFVDHSLIVRDTAGQVLALFPADRLGTVLRSHGGMTYGGFVFGDRMTVVDMGHVFDGVAAALRAEGVTSVIYKSIPAIYHVAPAEEDRYWLFRHGARLFRRDVLTVVDNAQRGPMQERRVRSLRKARAGGLEVRATDDFEAFWEILDQNLRDRHGVAPVHRVEEIRLLATRFPKNIRLYGAYDGDALIAGAVGYVSRNVCHVQYNAASSAGKQRGALDLVMAHMLDAYAATTRFFDFGASTERNGMYLNAGLVEYKEGFGARTVVQDMFEWDLTIAARSAG